MALTTDKLSQAQLQKLSPMMKQYLKIKAEHPDCIVFFDWATFMRCSLMTRFLFLKS